MSKPKTPIFDLDAEEQELSDSLDRGEWKSVKNVKQEIAKAQKAAANYLRKGARINIRISESDLLRIKKKQLMKDCPIKRL
jgi:predicted DNA binding CopG/RHH family protein